MKYMIGKHSLITFFNEPEYIFAFIWLQIFLSNTNKSINH